MSATEVKLRSLLATLRAVLDCPEARDRVEAVRTKSPQGYATGKKRLADARGWIDDIERQLTNAGGDESRLLPLLTAVERVSGFVMYVGEQRDISLDGAEPGIVAWRVIKQGCRDYKHFYGPDWHLDHPYWPRWTLPATGGEVAPE